MKRDQLKALRFMANCHNKAPLWDEYNRKAIADLLDENADLRRQVADLEELLRKEEARG